MAGKRALANRKARAAARKGPKDRKEVRLMAAKLYGRGFKRNQIAQALAIHIAPRAKPEIRLKSARQTLIRWEMQEPFRDLMWKHAVVKLDMDGPAILNGVSRKARTGRVDAARLAFELTGRHMPKGETQPTQIVLQMGNIPRPADLELPAIEESSELNGSGAEDG